MTGTPCCLFRAGSVSCFCSFPLHPDRIRHSLLTGSRLKFLLWRKPRFIMMIFPHCASPALVRGGGALRGFRIACSGNFLCTVQTGKTALLLPGNARAAGAEPPSERHDYSKRFLQSIFFPDHKRDFQNFKHLLRYLIKCIFQMQNQTLSSCR